MIKKSTIMAMLSIMLLAGCEQNPAQQSENGNKSLPADFSISDYRNWDGQRQADFMNSLKTESRIELLSLFLPNSTFNVPPNDFIKFLPGGEILVYSFTDDGTGARAKAKWVKQGKSIIVRRTDENSPFPKKDETWAKVKAEFNNDLTFILMYPGGGDDFTIIIYEKFGTDYF